MTRASRLVRGRWKLVIRPSTAANAWPGVMNRPVRPSQRSLARPSGDASDRCRPGRPQRRRPSSSRRRTMVVPTATTRRPAARAAAIRCNGGALDHERLLVEGVVLDALDRHRLEGRQADVKREVLDGDSGGAQRLVERRREVQPGGRRRRGAPQPGIDRLIALGVVERGPDVGRQRRLAVACQQTGERLGRIGRRTDPPATVAQRLAHLDREALRGDLAAQGLTAAQPAARQDLPRVARSAVGAISPGVGRGSRSGLTPRAGRQPCCRLAHRAGCRLCCRLAPGRTPLPAPLLGGGVRERATPRGPRSPCESALGPE